MTYRDWKAHSCNFILEKFDEFILFISLKFISTKSKPFGRCQEWEAKIRTEIESVGVLIFYLFLIHWCYFCHFEWLICEVNKTVDTCVFSLFWFLPKRFSALWTLGWASSIWKRFLLCATAAAFCAVLEHTASIRFGNAAFLCGFCVDTIHWIASECLHYRLANCITLHWYPTGTGEMNSNRWHSWTRKFTGLLRFALDGVRWFVRRICLNSKFEFQTFQTL